MRRFLLVSILCFAFSAQANTIHPAVAVLWGATVALDLATAGISGWVIALSNDKNNDLPKKRTEYNRANEILLGVGITAAISSLATLISAFIIYRQQNTGFNPV